ncbi:hypothetical protein WN944_006224 [Citrus x changshan-huyou]|uniref:Uncharacterized protein n=1 Tax=Citrus x changshan-huyou TaxID=2935761 RepID=A0AAP0MNM1_9ROSI
MMEEEKISDDDADEMEGFTRGVDAKSAGTATEREPRRRTLDVISSVSRFKRVHSSEGRHLSEGIFNFKYFKRNEFSNPGGYWSRTAEPMLNTRRNLNLLKKFSQSFGLR